ncbi:MAG TPA: CBS domain-containing protein, partial [Oculatellaceae cyanobacterium]
AKKKVIESLSTQMNNEKTAIEIMTTPVRTVRPDICMDEAGRIMLRYSLDGLVVMENDDIVGVVSKRDVDKARHHKLGHAPVRGFMSHPVISVRAESRLSEIQALMVAEDIGRLPVLDENRRLLGVVGRHELLAALYGKEENSDLHNAELTAARIHPEMKTVGTEALFERIDAELLNIYKELGAIAAELNMVAYLVGGCVRDLILDRENYDLDFVVEGSARKLALALVERLPQSYELIVEHARFDTAALYAHHSKRRELDIATARTEYYEYPAALPTVEPSSLEQDLYRRDFTINALALCLHPERFGEIVDYFNGLGDLNEGIIRVLHPFSFIEDPTRIVRAARFAARLSFKLDGRTKLQAERAIALGIFDNLGGVRLKEELKLILQSPQRIAALDLLEEMGGGLRFLDVAIKYDKRVRLHLRRAEKIQSAYSLSDPFVIFLGVLLHKLSPDALENALARLHLSDDERSWIVDAQSLLRGLLELNASPKRSQLYRVLEGHNEHSLAIAACVAPLACQLRRSIKLYFEELKGIKSSLRGKDLVELGIPQGPEIGKILEELRDMRLDGELTCSEDERAFVFEKYQAVLNRKKQS